MENEEIIKILEAHKEWIEHPEKSKGKVNELILAQAIGFAVSKLNLLTIPVVVCSYFMEDKTVYFQPPGIRPQFCEAGMISGTDPEYVWYYDEPCKILISDVKIIPKEDVIYDKKKRSYLVRSAL